MQETLQGMRSSRRSRWKTRCARARRSVGDVEHEANKMARLANRAGPLMETLGGIAIALAIDLRRLSRHRRRRNAGRILLVHRGVPARLRAGQAAGAAQSRPQQRAGRRAHAVRDHRQPADRADRRRQAAAATSPQRASNSTMCISPIGRTSRCCAACHSSPSRARSRRWSAHRAAASRPCST